MPPLFIGIRASKFQQNFKDGDSGTWGKSEVLHINLDSIDSVSERHMMLAKKDGTTYRIDEESLQIFLSAVYGENTVRGDRLAEEEL